MCELTILHISDLHFGIENAVHSQSKYVGIRQKEMLNSLVETLCDEKIITNRWKPQVIAISGDIAWSGQATEYELYKSAFVKQIVERVGIPSDHIIACPGNHDIIRDNVEEVSRPVVGQFERDAKEITFKNLSKRSNHFAGYVQDICGNTPENLCKVYHFDEWPWVYFLTLNSAWDCRDDYDEGRLRVSLPILESLIDQIPDDKKNCIITLFHHPHTPVLDVVLNTDKRGQFILEYKQRDWLHIYERIPTIKGGRSFASYVDQKLNYILNGHIHTETPPQYRDSAIQLICGTMYSNDTPEYHCRLLKICETGESTYRDIRRKLGDTDERWEVSEVKRFHLEPVSIKRRVLEAQRQKEREILLELDKASENYHQNLDGAELISVVDTIRKKIFQGMAEQFHSNSTISPDAVMDEHKINKDENSSQLTLKNGEEK